MEHAHQMPCLHELGCDEAQGYWLGRPAPAPCFEAELAAQGDAAGAAAEVLA